MNSDILESVLQARRKTDENKDFAGRDRLSRIVDEAAKQTNRVFLHQFVVDHCPTLLDQEAALDLLPKICEFGTRADAKLIGHLALGSGHGLSNEQIEAMLELKNEYQQAVPVTSPALMVPEYHLMIGSTIPIECPSEEGNMAPIIRMLRQSFLEVLIERQSEIHEVIRGLPGSGSIGMNSIMRN